MAKTFQQQLIDAVNAKNSSLDPALTVADVDFGAVSEASPSGDSDTRNSKITLTAKAESQHYKGEKEFHYTRLVSQSLITLTEVTAETTEVEDSVIIAKLNEDIVAKGYTDDEFKAEELTIQKADAGDGNFNYTVSVNEGHIKFLAGQIAVYSYKKPAPEKVALSGLEGELDGFTAPSVGG